MAPSIAAPSATLPSSTPASPTRLIIPASILPILQAILTGASTTLGVILVTLWRPNRARALPFYSDASHNDPERILLTSGENLACMLMPLVAIAEYLHHLRIQPHFPQRLHPLPQSRFLSTAFLVRLNFFVTLFTTVFFFLTANVPSRFPATRIHQISASALILFYAIQATCKALLAYTFANYPTHPDLDKPHPVKQERRCARLVGWWNRHHIKVRILLAVALWAVLLGTWVCFVTRVGLKPLGKQFERWRKLCATVMALLCHLATLSCVSLMLVVAVDLRAQNMVVSMRPTG